MIAGRSQGNHYLVVDRWMDRQMKRKKRMDGSRCDNNQDFKKYEPFETASQTIIWCQDFLLIMEKPFCSCHKIITCL